MSVLLDLSYRQISQAVQARSVFSCGDYMTTVEMLPAAMAGLQQMVSTCLDLGIHFREITFTCHTFTSSSMCDWFPWQQLHLASLTPVVQDCALQMQSCEIQGGIFTDGKKDFPLEKRRSCD